MATRQPAWTAIQVDLPEVAVDAVASFLMDEGASGVVTGQWDATAAPAAAGGRVRVEAHVDAQDAPRLAAAVASYLASLAAVEPEWARGATIAQVPLAPVDWEEQFRRHHRAMAVGDRLVVAPPWDVPAAPGRIVLVVEPGMAFGTGQHATTRCCLEEIDALVPREGIRTALDVGTGSGILAAALSRLGVARVVALDSDPRILSIARATLDGNGARDVRLVAGTAAALRGRFDLVVANLLADVLVADAGPLAALVAPRGRLVLSGLLAEQVPHVLAAYPGWQLTASRAGEEWRTVRLERST